MNISELSFVEERLTLARDHSTSSEVLKELVMVEYSAINFFIKHHPNTTEEIHILLRAYEFLYQLRYPNGRMLFL